MDSLFTILFIAVFIILSVRQDRKNKKQQQERQRRMAQEMNENENLGDGEGGEEERRHESFTTRPTMPTPQQMEERRAEMLRRHEEFLAKMAQQSEQIPRQNTSSAIRRTMVAANEPPYESPYDESQHRPAQHTFVPRSPIPAQPPSPQNQGATPKRAGGAKHPKTASSRQPAKPHEAATPPQSPPATATTTFDFDIERAVVEAEILRPKYLDY